jgi:hypothetical protein
MKPLFGLLPVSIYRSVRGKNLSTQFEPDAPAKAFLSRGLIFGLTVQFLAVGVFGQPVVTSPPPTTIGPVTLESSNASTVVANMNGLITLDGTRVVLTPLASAGQAAALLASGANAVINATDAAIQNNNAGPNFTFGVNATSPSGTGTATITLDGGTITADATGTGRAFGINSAVGGDC